MCCCMVQSSGYILKIIFVFVCLLLYILNGTMRPTLEFKHGKFLDKFWKDLHSNLGNLDQVPVLLVSIISVQLFLQNIPVFRILMFD